MASPNYQEQYVTGLFDQMGPSYDAVNLISSFGFSEIWRWQCVRNLEISPSAVVADLMAGSGECWTYLRQPSQARRKIVSVDFSPVMCQRQRKRLARRPGLAVKIQCENALALSLPNASVDNVISAFGLKTFNPAQLSRLAAEVFRILRPGGSCSFLEISLPQARWLQKPYGFYINSVIPQIGRLFVRDIECYKMLGVYTAAFGSCHCVSHLFTAAGFEVTLKQHFFGCASSLILKKAA